MLVQVDSPRTALDLQRCNSEKKQFLKLFCLPLPLDIETWLDIWDLWVRKGGTQAVSIHVCSRGRENPEQSWTCFTMNITAQMLCNGENSFTQAYTHFSCHFCGTGQRNALLPWVILGHFAQNMGSTSKTQGAMKNIAEQQLLAVCFQQWWEHGSSEVQWMLTAGHCCTPKGDRVSDTRVPLCLTCWPIKTCWDLKFYDNMKNRLSHKEEEKSNLGCWHSLFSKLFPGL